MGVDFKWALFFLVNSNLRMDGDGNLERLIFFWIILCSKLKVTIQVEL